MFKLILLFLSSWWFMIGLALYFVWLALVIARQEAHLRRLQRRQARQAETRAVRLTLTLYHADLQRHTLHII